MNLTNLSEIIDTFQSVDPEMRLELLLDYSKKLPPLPQRFHAQRDAGLNRVPECQTPVFLWVESNGDGVHLHADVAEESPTVRGFISILIQAFQGASAKDIAESPNELLSLLGLANHIRMTRAVGLTAVLARIKREVSKTNEVNLNDLRTPGED